MKRILAFILLAALLLPVSGIAETGKYTIIDSHLHYLDFLQETDGFEALVKKMDEAIASAKDKAGAKRMIWARRAAQYEENINSGDPMKLAEVVRDLQRRRAADTMTFSARQLYLHALERMAQEFAVLHKMDLDEASDKIEDILGVPKEIDLNAVDDEDEEESDESDEE